MEKDELKNIVLEAMDSFNRCEGYLIENDLSERCICSRFALHLTNALVNSEYKDYIADVEYNRGANGCERGMKRLDNKPITVDLVVHKRGYDCNYGFDNLICIEMKKTTNRNGTANDENRLAKLTDICYGFCYKLGLMLLIDMKENIIKIKSEF